MLYQRQAKSKAEKELHELHRQVQAEKAVLRQEAEQERPNTRSEAEKLTFELQERVATAHLPSPGEIRELVQQTLMQPEFSDRAASWGIGSEDVISRLKLDPSLFEQGAGKQLRASISVSNAWADIQLLEIAFLSYRRRLRTSVAWSALLCVSAICWRWLAPRMGFPLHAVQWALLAVCGVLLLVGGHALSRARGLEVGCARRLEELGVPDTDALEQRIQEAREQRAQTLLTQVIMPEVRALFNDPAFPEQVAARRQAAMAEKAERATTAAQVARLLSVRQNAGRVDVTGLSQVRNLAHQVPTGALDRLRRLLALMPGGSVGVAGPRGVGKTTLLSMLCSTLKKDARGRPVLPVVAAAPVGYDPREFVIHLFALVCRSVLDVEGAPSVRDRRPLPRMLNRQLRWTSYLGAALVYLAVATGYYRAVAPPSPPAPNVPAVTATSRPTVTVTSRPARPSRAGAAIPTRPTSTPPVSPRATAPVVFLPRIVDAFGVSPGALLLSGLVLMLGPLAWSRRRARRPSDETRMPRDAQEWLRELTFQQSLSFGSSTALKVPVGLEGGWNASTSLTERPLSLPEIIDGYREFLGDLSTRYTVIICIDELDKIASQDAAERFLNDIKGLFGLEHCFYLLSISEGALSGYERRGLPLRDAFDSALDEVVQIPCMGFGDAKLLLMRRVSGLSDACLALCYCLSGGLPRDLIRACRQLVQLIQADPDRAQRIADLSEALILNELRAKLDATSYSMSETASDPAVARLLEWLSSLPNTTESAAGVLAPCRYLLAQGRAAQTSPPAQQSSTSLAIHFGAYAYLALTVLQYFRDANAEDFGVDPDTQPCPFEPLAEARRHLQVNPWNAVKATTAFREAHHMPTLPFPDQIELPV